MIIAQFKGKYRWLSNFWPCLILYRGVLYPSVEHAYQAQKNPTSEMWVEFCTNRSYSAAKVKIASHSITKPKNWKSKRVRLMTKLCRLKFEQPYFRERLLKTKSALIQEGNYHHDTFWGVDLETGIGENNLGKIIMQLRQELK